jgi:prepilin-type N-terminal cleavage/methylation domain-containing protein
MKRWTNMVGKVWRTEGQSKAFTIVELLIVIVVIGILALVTVLGYNAVVNKANDKSVQADLGKIADAVKLFNLDNNVYPSSFNDIASAMQKGTVTVAKGGYSIDSSVISNHNLDYCYTPGNGANFAVVAISKAKTIFYVTDSSSGVQIYNGTWPSTASAICAAIAPTSTTYSRGYASDDTTTGPWRTWTGVGTPSVTNTNLAANPSFESNTSGVLLYNSALLTRVASASAGSGSYVGRVIKTVSGTGLIALVYPTSYTPNADISIRMKVRLSPGSNPTNTVSIFIPGYNGGNGVGYSTKNGNASLISSGPLSSTTWTDITLQGYKTVNDPTLNNIGIGIQTDQSWTATDGVDIDAIMIVNSPTIAGFADGNTAGWTWTGTANASSSTGPSQAVSN